MTSSPAIDSDGHLASLGRRAAWNRAAWNRAAWNRAAWNRAASNTVRSRRAGGDRSFALGLARFRP